MDTNDKNIIELDKKSTTPQAYDLIMSAEEKELFIETIKDSSVRNYLEFGSGGSTFTALLNSQANVFSVESNLDFIDHLRTWDYIKESEKNKRLIFEHINIGKVGDWGMPLEKEKIELFPNYSELIFKKHNIRFDCILIDGRFRIACTLNSILNGCVFTKYIIHDFWNRPKYRIVLKYLDVIAYEGTMLIARAKGNINITQLCNDINRFKYDPE